MSNSDISCPVLDSLRRVQITCLAGLIYAGLSAELWQAASLADPLDLVAMFSLSHETNLPTWFASSQLLVCALAIGVVAIDSRQAGGRFLAHWWGLAAALLYISIDETLQLHEEMNQWFSTGGVLYFGWVIPASVIVAVFVLSYLKFLGHLPKRTRNRFVSAGAIFVGGALGVELGLGYWTDLEGDENLVYGLIDWLEESMELCGIGLMLYSVAEYALDGGVSWIRPGALHGKNVGSLADEVAANDALEILAQPAPGWRSALARLASVWALVVVVGGVIVATGLSTRFFYEDMRGTHLERPDYVGEDLRDELRGGHHFVFVGPQRVFDREPEARGLLLIAMGGAALLYTLSLGLRATLKSQLCLVDSAEDGLHRRV